ncbi:ribonuclease inhibitor-like [Triplophysa dalaica]|uniref:ribonuclease inhibitor-like n=1 Tax=Triplophysa dalaica TaxID=1582913 RepID=UPI0024DFC127|nr:ribonuclease inhibitor-like [Triplophysa dalaica]
MKMKNEKYDPERDPEINREVIVKLAEVAFKQLMKGNVMFYEEDLRECGIDITDASLYSGICTEIFKEESVIHQRKIYSFIHLTVQEFLAAFYWFHCCTCRTLTALEDFRPLYNMLKVNDQTLYREIEEFVRSDKHSEKKLSAAHCSAIAYMLQMSEEVMDEFDLKKYNTTQEGRRRLTPAVNNCTRALLADLTVKSCRIIASALQSSECPLRDLDVSNNDLQDSGVKLISDAIKNTNCHLEILRLSGCMVTDEGCCYLASALSSNPSHLRELDLSYNHPQHSTLQLLAYQDDPNYTLNKLNLENGEHFRITRTEKI